MRADAASLFVIGLTACGRSELAPVADSEAITVVESATESDSATESANESEPATETESAVDTEASPDSTCTRSFAPQVTYVAGKTPSFVAVGDFERDGSLDLAVGDWNAGTVSLLPGAANGAFGKPVAFDTGLVMPSLAVVGDVNGDGFADIVVASYDPIVSVMLNDANGGFTAPATYALKCYNGFNITLDHFRAGGVLDLAVGETEPNSVGLMFNDGAGTFAAAVTYAQGGGDWINFIASGDLNGDGAADLAVVKVVDNTISLFFNRGDGTFAVPVTMPASDYPSSVLIADLNGDHAPDLLVTFSNGQPYYADDNNVGVFLNQGDGTFDAPVTYDVGAFNGFVVGDFNGDGAIDFAGTDYNDNLVAVWTNAGDGTFTAGGSCPVGNGPGSLAAGDFNGDGVFDLAWVNFVDDNVGVLLSQCR